MRGRNLSHVTIFISISGSNDLQPHLNSFSFLSSSRFIFPVDSLNKMWNSFSTPTSSLMLWCIVPVLTSHFSPCFLAIIIKMHHIKCLIKRRYNSNIYINCANDRGMGWMGAKTVVSWSLGGRNWWHMNLWFKVLRFDVKKNPSRKINVNIIRLHKCIHATADESNLILTTRMRPAMCASETSPWDISTWILCLFFYCLHQFIMCVASNCWVQFIVQKTSREKECNSFHDMLWYEFDLVFSSRRSPMWTKSAST